MFTFHRDFLEFDPWKVFFLLSYQLLAGHNSNNKSKWRHKSNSLVSQYFFTFALPSVQQQCVSGCKSQRAASQWRQLPSLPKKVASRWAAPTNIQIYRLSPAPHYNIPQKLTHSTTQPFQNITIATLFFILHRRRPFFYASYYYLLNFKCLAANFRCLRDLRRAVSKCFIEHKCNFATCQIDKVVGLQPQRQWVRFYEYKRMHSLLVLRNIV